MRFKLFKHKIKGFELKESFIAVPFQFIASEYNALRNKIELKMKKREALQLYSDTGRQQHIIPTDKGMAIVDNRQLKAYNKRMKHAKITVDKLLQMAYFSTGSSKSRII